MRRWKWGDPISGVKIPGSGAGTGSPLPKLHLAIGGDDVKNLLLSAQLHMQQASSAQEKKTLYHTLFRIKTLLTPLNKNRRQQNDDENLPNCLIKSLKLF